MPAAANAVAVSDAPATVAPVIAAAAATVAPTERHNKKSWRYAARSLLAGGIAGCAAKTVIAPLDRVKILFQTGNPYFEKYSGSMVGVVRASREILLSDGVLGLFQGHSATLLRIFPYAAIKFMSYEQFKAHIMPTKSHETPLRRFVAGSLAGMTCVLCTYPLDLLRTRLAFEVDAPPPPSSAGAQTHPHHHRRSLLKIAWVVYHERNPFGLGVFNFYRGFIPTLYGIVPYAGVSFLTYETLRSWAMRSSHLRTAAAAPAPAAAASQSPPRRPKMELNWWAQILVGGVSGAAASTVSYPLEVIRRRMQVQGRAQFQQARPPNAPSASSAAGAAAPARFVSTLQMAGDIFRTKGVRGFFVGLSIGYIKIFPMHAVSFYVYEYMKVKLHIV